MRPTLEDLTLWLAAHQGLNLISDDGGRWAISTCGVQPTPEPDGFKDTVAITSYVDPEEWKPSIREAIEYAISQEMS